VIKLEINVKKCMTLRLKTSVYLVQMFMPVILAKRGRSGDFRFKDSLGKKFKRPPSISDNRSDMVAHTCHPRYTGSISRRNAVQASPGINVRLCWKNN
jgi:hypothetical protein